MAYVEEISLEEAMQSHPSIELAKESKLPLGDTLQNLNTNSSEDFFPTCFVEEETPLDGITGTEAPLGLSTRATMDSRQQAPDVSGGMEQPSFSELWHLPLIFELRSLMDDQVFLLARIDQRLDMLFAAHSKNPTQRQCPTCAQTYSLPVGWC